MKRGSLGVLLFLVAATVQAADPHNLAAVTITNVQPDLPSMTVAYTVTNGSSQPVTAWAVEIRSIYGEDFNKSIYSVDEISADSTADKGPLAPGASRRHSGSLNQVRLRTPSADVAADTKVDPAAADVLMAMVVFADNTAYGNEREIRNIERLRAYALKAALSHLSAIEDTRTAADPRAHVAQLLAVTPAPQTLPQGPHPVPRRDETYSTALQEHRWLILRQIQGLLDNPPPNMTVTQILDLVSAWPKTASTRLTGHTKLIRAQAQ